MAFYLLINHSVSGVYSVIECRVWVHRIWSTLHQSTVAYISIPFLWVTI